jgi:Histidine kinase-, DNA gyrase B-, and HSP90-like ATPase
MPSDAESGKLKIGDHWNVITIIALSQNNPLKAIAEFVENSIDAGAKNVTIIRGKQRNEQYLKVVDDGHGIKDFRYVATHIGDSIKRELKKKGEKGIQGEFGIGLLSFWTVGGSCTITSAGEDGKARSLRLVKGDPTFAIRESEQLFGHQGTELTISPVLPGVRGLSGDKIQNFLASELRDRISKSGVRIRIVDHSSRRELVVEPRKFRGRLIHEMPEARSPFGEIYFELYFAEASQENAVGLFRQGTRVLADISKLERFSQTP